MFMPHAKAMSPDLCGVNSITTGSFSGSAQPQPVAGLRANPFGLYDMFGNVSEWCLDFHGDYPKGRIEDYRGPDSHPKDWHVMQGTAYHSVVTARWKRWRANSCGDQLGFRVVRELP
jgi:formylglycine-generating enzyme required for sulfatase activity